MADTTIEDAQSGDTSKDRGFSSAFLKFIAPLPGAKKTEGVLTGAAALKANAQHESGKKSFMEIQRANIAAAKNKTGKNK